MYFFLSLTTQSENISHLHTILSKWKNKGFIFPGKVTELVQLFLQVTTSELTQGANILEKDITKFTMDPVNERNQQSDTDYATRL